MHVALGALAAPSRRPRGARAWWPEQSLLAYCVCVCVLADNEFLVDGNVWDENLPFSIEAFMTSKGDGGLSVRAHAAFLSTYSVSAAEVPLLTMTRSLTNLFVVGTKFAEHGDPCGVDRGRGWMDRPPWDFSGL